MCNELYNRFEKSRIVNGISYPKYSGKGSICFSQIFKIEFFTSITRFDVPRIAQSCFLCKGNFILLHFNRCQQHGNIL